jgi:hypothetical protein
MAVARDVTTWIPRRVFDTSWESLESVTALLSTFYTYSSLLPLSQLLKHHFWLFHWTSRLLWPFETVRDYSNSSQSFNHLLRFLITSGHNCHPSKDKPRNRK